MVRHYLRHAHGPAFFIAWLRAPLRTGSPVPSGESLARAMAEQVDVNRPGYIIELGAGTGVVTSALIKAGIPRDRLLVIERNQAFFDLLQEKFPDTQILQQDAQKLTQILRQQHIHEINAVVSSLPLLSLPAQVQRNVVEQVASVLGPDSIYIQYTYGLLSPVPKRLLHGFSLTGRRVRRIWRNIPPAFIWRYTKKSA
ncbi:MAG: methyltransferase domain-containing protein [Alphaproteobacteria bacterium]|nr:methyltransferase domain-containing protein [Alphaproteobacteria bacterium]